MKKSIPLSAKKHKLDEYSMLKSQTNAYIRTLQDIMDEKSKALEQAMASKDPTAISKATAEYDQAKANFDSWNKKINEYDVKIKRYS